MPVLSRCKAPACEVLTIGPYCIKHDATRLTILARQRRWRWDRAPRAVVEPVPGVESEPVATRK
jgi:hypothetical protein